MTEYREGFAGQRGFSLLEVLVAFSILSVSLGALLTFFSNGLHNVSVAREYNRAVIMAESKLAELEAQPTLSVGAREGVFDDQYRWHAEITGYPADTASPDPGSLVQTYKVTVTVFWGDMPGPRSVVLTSLRFGNG